MIDKQLNDKMGICVTVYLRKPLEQTYDYFIESEKTALYSSLQAGSLVGVPFGKKRYDTSSLDVGFVIHTSTLSDQEAIERGLKPVLAHFEHPIFNPLAWKHWWQLLEFSHHYYCISLRGIIFSVLPNKLLQVKHWPLAQKRITKILAGLATKTEPSHSIPITPSSPPFIKPSVHSLTPHQLAAHAAIAEAFPKPALLFGVTGSGKTEVYLATMERWLSQSSSPQQILLLVPEINLTPQLIDRIQNHFPCIPVTGLHSKLTDAQRFKAWFMIQQSITHIIVGTRLAIFTPIPNLCGIIVDEEHDSSYRQSNAPSYSARDLAVWRANHEHIPIILGSATPSLESWYACIAKRYECITLSERANQSSLPKIELIVPQSLINNHRGISKAHQSKYQQIDSAVLDNLIAQITPVVEAQQQTLILLNRRGFSPKIYCAQCGWVLQCVFCHTRLVWHKHPPHNGHAVCHLCDYHQAIPPECPSCGALDIRDQGQGTQKLEARLQARLPHLRILRIDSDNSTNSTDLERHLNAIHRQEIDVIIGTQMLAKGHDFKNINKIIVLDADNALFTSHFRSEEKLFALLMQVAGRAGRHTKNVTTPAQVTIYTQYPEHPIFQHLLTHDYPGFAQHQLQQRQLLHLPPYSHLIRWSSQFTCADKALQHITAVHQTLASMIASWKPSANIKLSPIFPCEPFLQRNQFHYQFFVTIPTRPLQQQLLKIIKSHQNLHSLTNFLKFSTRITSRVSKFYGNPLLTIDVDSHKI